MIIRCLHYHSVDAGIKLELSSLHATTVKFVHEQGQMKENFINTWHLNHCNVNIHYMNVIFQVMKFQDI